jgi:nitrite reductase/ring-hydroxylating ferredoxin subunit
MMARRAARENSSERISSVQFHDHERGVFDTGIRADELQAERPRPVDTPWGSFALYVVEGRVIASQSFCPHLEGPLFQGSIVGSQVTCPWHRWRFDLLTGERLDAPDAAHRLRSCAVRTSAKGTLELEAPRDWGIRAT